LTRPDGEPAREVKFYATGMSGHCTVLIGERTGMDYTWSCDMAPLMAQMGGMFKNSSNNATTTTTTGGPETTTTTTTGGPAPKISEKMSLGYIASDVKTNESINPARFDTTKLPESKMPDFAKMLGGIAKSGPSSSPPPSSAAELPPLAVGSTAPSFDVRALSGGAVSLASLKGKPAMIDFWATWCGPCRETLPDTDKISQKYKNLTVLAVSDEDKPTVQKFVTDNHYKFRACLDTSGAMHRAYHVEGIPCFVFIDSSGKVSQTIIGGGQSSDVEAALKKIGAKG
jgi:thiol-disulfide isomerase/thioredoxin